ncbi:hypothetical protein KI387_035330, partial [Taxus chinensis]
NDDFSNLNGTYSDIGSSGDGLVTSEVATIDVLRNGFPNAPGKNSDVSSVLRVTEKIPEDIQIHNIITTASTSTGTIPRDLNALPIATSQEIPAAPLLRNISSKTLSATDSIDPRSFSSKLHTGIVSGRLFGSGDETLTSSQNEYFQSTSQPVGIYQIDQNARSNEKPQLRIASQPKQVSTTAEVKNGTYESGSSSISKILNVAAISARSFAKEEEPSSSILQESDHLLSPTAKLLRSICKDDDEKIVLKSTSRDRERDLPNQKPHKDSSGSSGFSRRLQGTLFSGGLFDDEDELIFSSTVESVNVWSQPSVPDRLFDTLSENKKDAVVLSSNVGRVLNQAEHNPSDGMITTNIHVSAEGRHQFSAVENTDKTSFTNDHIDKPYHDNPSLKESLSLLQKGLFDDGDSDEDDDPGDLFRAHLSLGQKHRAHDGTLVSGSNLVRGLSIAGISLNIPNEMHASLPETDEDYKPHKIDVDLYRTAETIPPADQIISNISTIVQNPGYENIMSDLDNNKEVDPPLKLTEYVLDPEKIPFPSTALLPRKPEPVPHFDLAIAAHNHSDGDSDSWSSSGSEKDIKPDTILDITVETSSDSTSEINNDKFNKVVLEPKGFSHSAGETASLLHDGESGNLIETASLLDPNNDGREDISNSKEDIVQKGISLPVRPAEFESPLADKNIEEKRLEAAALTSLSNSLFSATTSYQNWSKVTQPRVGDQAQAEIVLPDVAPIFVSNSVSLISKKKCAAAAVSFVGVDIPKRTGSQSGDRQTESLWKNKAPHSTEHSRAELSDQSKVGWTVLAKPVPAPEGAIGKYTSKEDISSIPSTSLSNKKLESDVPSGPSDKETKDELSSNVLSQSTGLTDTPLPSPQKETKAPPSRHMLLFGDEDEEMEASLFGPIPKENSKATPLKTPGKRHSLFDSDED